MSFGITNEGFNIKRLSDILLEIETDEKNKWSDIDVSAESRYGQLNGVFANQCAELWEVAEMSYLSSSPSSAEGISLDNILAQNNLIRLEALSTIVDVGLKGSDATIIPQDTQISSTVDNKLFNLKTAITLTKDNILKTYIEIKNIVDSNLYQITINGTTNYDYTSDSSATLEEILQGITNLINNDLTAVIIAEKFDSYIKIETKSIEFSFTYNTDLDHYTVGVFESVEKGPILAVENTLTVIETPVSGLDSVNNFEVGEKGRDIETDTEARIRRKTNLITSQGSILDAMVTILQNDIDGVLDVKGFENREDITVDGRPPHCFEIVVTGGLDEDIGNMIWQIKPSGITTFGNTYYDITDSKNKIQRMYFSRPINVYLWMKIDITLYSEEEFPSDGLDQVKNAVLVYGENLGSGVDVIPGRFYGSIYAITGIETITISTYRTLIDPDTPTYTTDIKVIDETEISIWDLTRIEVNQI